MPCVLVPVLGEKFNLIMAVMDSSKPHVLKDVPKNTLLSEGEEKDQFSQIIDMCYNKVDKQIITGHLNGIIGVYSIQE